MVGGIPCHQRDCSGSQNHVLQEELSHQGEQGEGCHPWDELLSMSFSRLSSGFHPAFIGDLP